MFQPQFVIIIQTLLVVTLLYVDQHPILQLFLVSILMTAYTLFLTHFRPFYNRVHLRLAVFNQASILLCLLLSFFIYFWLSTTLERADEMYILYSLGFCSIFLILLSTILVYPLLHIYLIMKQTCKCPKLKIAKISRPNKEKILIE